MFENGGPAPCALSVAASRRPREAVRYAGRDAGRDAHTAGAGVPLAGISVRRRERGVVVVVCGGGGGGGGGVKSKVGV